MSDNRQLIRLRLSLFVAVCLAAMSSLALSQAAPAAPPQNDEAVAAYQRGAAAFGEGDFHQAQAEFSDSFKRRNHPLTAYFLSYTYLKLYDFKSANYWANLALSPMPPFELDQTDVAGAQEIATYAKAQLAARSAPRPPDAGGISMTTSAITVLPKPHVPGNLTLAPHIGMKAAYKGQTILVETATYAGNCSAARGNDTDHLGNGCNGKDECRYTVDVAVIGDPAPGCVKDYEVVYACSGSKTRKTVQVTGEEAGFKKTVVLTCP